MVVGFVDIFFVVQLDSRLNQVAGAKSIPGRQGKNLKKYYIFYKIIKKYIFYTNIRSVGYALQPGSEWEIDVPQQKGPDEEAVDGVFVDVDGGVVEDGEQLRHRQQRGSEIFVAIVSDPVLQKRPCMQ